MKAALRNIFAIVTGDVAVRFLGFLVTIYLARVLGPSLFGVISVGFAVLGYLGQLSGSGVQMLEARNTAAQMNIDLDRVGAISSLRLLLAVILLLMTAAAAFLFVENGETRDALWLYALMLLPLALYLDWFFQGKEQFGILSLSKVLNYGIYALAVYLLVEEPRDFRFAPLALLLGTSVAAIVLIIRFRKSYGDFRLRLRPALWGDLLRQSLPLGFAVLLGQSSVNAAPIIIGLEFTNADVGMYSAAMKIIVLLLLLDRTVNSFYLPVVSRLQASRPEELPQVVMIALKVVMIVVLPLAGCCFVAADDVVTLLYGSGYSDAVVFLRSLLAYFVLTVPNSVLVCTMVGSGREAAYKRIIITGSLILVSCTIISSIVFGPLGATLGVALGEFFTLLMFLHETKSFVALSIIRTMIRPLVAFLVMMGVALLFDHWSTITLLAASLSAFVLAIAGFRGLERGEIRFLRRRLV